MKTLNLAPRMESHERYEANRAINNMIAESFASSVQHFMTVDLDDCASHALPEVIVGVDSPFFVNPIHYVPCGDLKFGNTTLRESGCAVFCFYQGLLTQNIYADLEDFTTEVFNKGYLEPGKGIWHNLFDHFGLRRASHYQDIVDAICRGSISTCLVSNSMYHNDSTRTGNHFVNIVGLDGGANVIVDDSHLGRQFMNFKAFLDAVLVSWIW